MNILLQTDSYKATHWRQYPPKTTKVYSYFESRRGAKFDKTVFFGLQYILKKYLSGPVLNAHDMRVAEQLLVQHFDRSELMNWDGWHSMLRKHNGYLPLEIKAVPEGIAVPTGNVLMTVENTDPEFYWLTNYVESLLTHIWYPCTVASQGRVMRETIQHYLELTGTPKDAQMKMHDFGFRGVTCSEQAGIGGLAHLVNFEGTDNLAALECGARFYSEPCAGVSIPASEHSTMTSWGRDGEEAAYSNMLMIYPSSPFACVSDSWDIFNACTNLWGGSLKMKVLASGGLVIRPDSGDPLTVLPKVLSILASRFGSTVNDKGYVVLHPKIRVLQGDGVDLESLETILRNLWVQGWSADNIAFGSGGGLLQKMNRDTQRFAFKCSSVDVDGSSFDVYKDPITDPGKVSKKGRLKLVRFGDTFHTVGEGELGEDVLQTVFLNGRLTNETNLSEVRERSL